jgi:primosomal protein N' (replication factor Y)
MRRLQVRTPSLFGPEPELDAPPSGPEPALYVDVVVDRPVGAAFTYGADEAQARQLERGMRVAVPFGRGSREVGVVVGLERTRPASLASGARLRSVIGVLDEAPLVGADLLELTRWLAREYACSWGSALLAILPAGLKRERGVAQVAMVAAAPGLGAEQLEELERRSPKQHRLLRTLLELGGPIELRDLLSRLNLSSAPVQALVRRGWVHLERVPAQGDDLTGEASDRPRPAALTPAQQAAVEAVLAPLEARRPAAFLLEGVTGSGKTEVYLATIERALELGRSAIVLVPEIALTPQTVGWFRARFEAVAVLHSRMTDAQRLRTWRRVQAGDARVVVGARSALFAPVLDLGVVVVDEEHEPSFKQSSAPRYHARDVALERARAAGAVCILGSATPSLESFEAARSGRITSLALPERISGHGFPVIEVVDMRREPARKPAERGTRLFSRRLIELLDGALARGEQAILFQNRRGFAPVLWCSGCSETLRCAQCDVGLTWHRRIRRMVCHVCCEERAVPGACPTCTKPGLHRLGAGSERVEGELGLCFPAARVRRMDSDTMRRREDYEEALASFGRGEVDVLVGTQMIAKGLDFPRVTVVGIVDADAALHLPDFRSAERTFQLISQVAGRAGRGALAGRIVVQTTVPEHPAIARAAAHDYRGFAAAESALRAELAYPPHGRLVRVLVEDEAEALVETHASRAAAAARGVPGVVVLGPAPAPIALIRRRHRHHVMIKVPRAAPGDSLARLRDTLLAAAQSQRRPRVTIDVDPVSVL